MAGSQVFSQPGILTTKKMKSFYDTIIYNERKDLNYG